MRHKILIAMLTLAAATWGLPGAAADPNCPLEMDDGSNPVYIGDSDDRCGSGCNSVNVVIADPGGCDGGCRGVTVLVGSRNACEADRGTGCDGITVIDPTSGGSCEGGPGGMLMQAVM